MAQNQGDTVGFSTDTATICLFDPEALAHRLESPADWWSDPDAEIEEVNAGNALFVDLGADGHYEAHLREKPTRGTHGVVARIRCVSGHLFIGAGEDVVADGYTPDAALGGALLDLARGTYEVAVSRSGPGDLEVSIRPGAGEARNAFADSPSL